MKAAKEKMDRLLEAAVNKIAEADPDYMLELEITPRNQEDVAEIMRHIAEFGGSVEQMDMECLKSRIPVSQVRRLASSDSVSELRLIRRHRMH